MAYDQQELDERARNMTQAERVEEMRKLQMVRGSPTWNSLPYEERERHMALTQAVQRELARNSPPATPPEVPPPVEGL